MFIQHPHLGFNGLTAIDLVSYDIIIQIIHYYSDINDGH